MFAPKSADVGIWRLPLPWQRMWTSFMDKPWSDVSAEEKSWK